VQEFLLNPGFGQALALTAAALLIFVSVAVIYLSTIEWRDRRRRRGFSGKG
jgi:hypothetical protein